jgi:hypothetical protein
MECACGDDMDACALETPPDATLFVHFDRAVDVRAVREHMALRSDDGADEPTPGRIAAVGCDDYRAWRDGGVGATDGGFPDIASPDSDPAQDLGLSDCVAVFPRDLGAAEVFALYLTEGWSNSGTATYVVDTLSIRNIAGLLQFRLPLLPAVDLDAQSMLVWVRHGYSDLQSDLDALAVGVRARASTLCVSFALLLACIRAQCCSCLPASTAS